MQFLLATTKNKKESLKVFLWQQLLEYQFICNIAAADGVRRDDDVSGGNKGDDDDDNVVVQYADDNDDGLSNITKKYLKLFIIHDYFKNHLQSCATSKKRVAALNSMFVIC